MEKVETKEKVIDFVQSDINSKKFRLDYPVSEELRGMMVDQVFSDFMAYALEQYYDDENLLLLKEFIDDLCSRTEKKEALLHHLFWWKLFYEASQYPYRSCMEDYLTDHFFTMKNQPFIAAWLRECMKMVPKFYFIGHKYNNRTFIAVDILTHTTLEVMVFDPKAVPPKRGELAMGMLMPLGGGLYFPIVDFYHFDYKSREAIASCFHYHHHKYSKNAGEHETFLHVLSVMLQIEKMILNKEASPAT
ncbi:hypothetical protein [Neobacillus mesonae]|uniref:hypothetical protein n=1 Tax=Neobacillus mesonae TaxID=1193713 RepID=UPI00203CC3A7|nr:hypothetical protein [Neobacillus mesonae]MCM3567618.1 hypothetical protein [Neobacillus mesonae]